MLLKFIKFNPFNIGISQSIIIISILFSFITLLYFKNKSKQIYPLAAFSITNLYEAFFFKNY